MRSSSSAGLLLLLVAFIGIAGFLTGNLDRWLQALFSATPPTAPASSASSSGLPTVQGSVSRATA